MKKVLNIGPLPKPLGGVSVHIIRLSKLLSSLFEVCFVDESKHKKTQYFNIYSCNPLKYFMLIASSDVVHIHSGSSLMRNVHILGTRLLFKPTIVTIHSYARKSSLTKSIDHLFLRLANKIIAVNNDISERINLPKKTIIQYAFIPPVIDEEPELPKEVIAFLDKRKKEGCFTMAANAWRLDLFKNQDLYGLDLCIELVHQLKNAGHKPAFVFVVSSLDKGKDLFDAYQEQIRRLGLTNEFLLINTELSFSKLITLVDLVLRPTNTDGDALTIREAIYLNKPVIASDVVARPEGTILFQNRNVSSLTNAVQSVMEKDKIDLPSDKNDYQSIYLNIYKECVG